jgi:sugar/nucleoside kinase (ribokinase family)
MPFITKRPEAVLDLAGRIEVLLLNRSELRALTGAGPEAAVGRLLDMGLEWVVITNAEKGATAWSRDAKVYEPAVLSPMVDPTGCGDAMAGGLVSVLAKERALTPEAMRVGLRLGARMAAHAGSSFSADGLFLAVEALRHSRPPRPYR